MFDFSFVSLFQLSSFNVMVFNFSFLFFKSIGFVIYCFLFFWWIESNFVYWSYTTATQIVNPITRWWERENKSPNSLSFTVAIEIVALLPIWDSTTTKVLLLQLRRQMPMRPLDMLIIPSHWQWRGGDEVDLVNEERKDKRSLSGRVFERMRMRE